MHKRLFYTNEFQALGAMLGYSLGPLLAGPGDRRQTITQHIPAAGGRATSTCRHDRTQLDLRDELQSRVNRDGARASYLFRRAHPQSTRLLAADQVTH